MPSLWGFAPLAFNKKLCLTAFFPRGMGHGSSPSSDQVCTAHRQNLGKIRWFTESQLTYRQVYFCLDFLVKIYSTFPHIQMLELKIIGQNIIWIYFVPGKNTKKEKVDRHGNRFEMFQNVSFIPWDAGLYLMHPRCCSCFQQYLWSFTEPGKMMGLRAWRSSPQGLLSVVEGGLEEMFCWLPVTLTF